MTQLDLRLSHPDSEALAWERVRALEDALRATEKAARLAISSLRTAAVTLLRADTSERTHHAVALDLLADKLTRDLLCL